MRVMDWRTVFTEHRVPFIESGPNVKRGEINIRCPFCGSADPSHHMGINLETGWYSCWRNRKQHSGKSPLRLLMRLLGITYGMAREMAGLGDDYVDPEGFDAVAAIVLARGGDARPEALKRRTLRLDDDFRVINGRGSTRRHMEYLIDQRGFRNERHVALLGEWYGVCAGVHGAWNDRIVLPYYQDNALMTWTARAIAESSMRYRDLERLESILPPKETLFNHDAMHDAPKVIVLVEGPMDALKLDFYGRARGVRAIALSTNSVTDEQSFLLQSAARSRVLVMMDNTGSLDIVDSMRMQQELAFIPGLEIVPVPFGAKDAADLTPAEIREWSEAHGTV